jgi:pantothenate kinase
MHAIQGLFGGEVAGVQQSCLAGETVRSEFGIVRAGRHNESVFLPIDICDGSILVESNTKGNIDYLALRISTGCDACQQIPVGLAGVEQ